MFGQQNNLEIGEQARQFKGTAYVNGEFKELSLDKFKGKYLVLFFYPLDFTFVCPTEIIAFNELYKEFKESGAEVVGCSVDSHFSHMRWSQLDKKQGGLGNVDFPLLSDITKEISLSYNALVTKGNNRGVSNRATYIIDGKGILRHMQLNDLGVGRNVDEILRLVKAFIYSDKNGEVCPSHWRKPGDATMVPSHDSEKTKEYFSKEM